MEADALSLLAEGSPWITGVAWNGLAAVKKWSLLWINQNYKCILSNLICGKHTNNSVGMYSYFVQFKLIMCSSA